MPHGQQTVSSTDEKNKGVVFETDIHADDPHAMAATTTALKDAPVVTHTRHQTVASRLRSLFTGSREKTVYDRESNLSWLTTERVPEAFVNQKITGAHDEVFRDHRLSATQRRKRKRAFREKAGIQRDMLNALEDFTDDREQTASLAEELRKEREPEESDGSLYEQSLDWAQYYTATGREGADSKKVLTGLNDLRAGRAEEEADRLLSEICAPDLDLSVFTYKDDKDFTKRFRENYACLRAFGNARRLMELRTGSGERLHQDWFLLETRLRFFETCLKDYESRMKILQSPYYPLMAGKDFESMTPEALTLEISLTQDEGLRTFLEAVRDKKTSGFGSGMKTDQLMEKIREDTIREDRETKEEIFRVLTDGDSESITLASIKRVGREKASESYTPLTHETMRTEYPKTWMRKNDMILQLNEAAERLLDGETVEGMTLDEELKSEFLEWQNRIMEAQDKVGLSNAASLWIDSCQDKLHASNPVYTPQEKEIVKKIHTLLGKASYAILEENNTETRRLLELITQFSQWRFDHGINLSRNKKSWKRLMEQTDAYQQEGTLTIGGQEYKCFLADAEIGAFAGKRFQPLEGVTKEVWEGALERLNSVLKKYGAYIEFYKEKKLFLDEIDEMDIGTCYHNSLTAEMFAAREAFFKLVEEGQTG